MKLILSVLLCLIAFTSSCQRPDTSSPSFSQIESSFRNIPDSVQTSVYWYWVSDNISKEGVVKDLQAMKKVGINRAFIGNIGLNEGYSRIPYGKVKIFTDEWWDILHIAFKTATDLDIEIGIFNSPGWSQSGGPWIKPEQSMRYLNSSEIVVTGPQQFNQKLIAPNADFQRVNVIAYKAPVDFGLTLRAFNPKITSVPELSDIKNIMDGDVSTQIRVQGNKILTVDFETAEIATVRSLIIRTAETPIKAKGVLQAKQDNEFRKLKDFVIDRSKPDLSVGFDPWAPIVISVPDTESSVYRLVISESDPAGAIAEVELSAAPGVERYPEKSLAKMFQTPLPFWHDYMWPDQPEVEDNSLVIDPQQVLDITKYISSDGTLNWIVPEGRWVIMQTGMTSTRMLNGSATAEGTGVEVDKMSKELIKYNFDAFLGEIIRRVPAEDRKTWKVVVADSYECGSQNWTDGFIEDFADRYGYDPVPFIPVLKGYVVGSRTISDRFLWDLRRMVADKIAYDYLGGLREESHKHGLTTWLENYGHWGFPGEFLQYGGQSDAVAGEFWSEGDLGNIENRAASSCAHIYGKNIVSSESFTSGGVAFSRYPAKMKQRGDRFFTEGINNTLLHVYIQQPDETLPGVNAWFGNEFNRHNTWFSQLDLFTRYLKRCNYMLQQGNYVADAAYFIGEDVPKMTGVCDPPLPKGYSFDYINSEVLHQRTTVKDGKIVLPDGLSYRILVLPRLETMRPEMLERIKELVEQGAVVLGPAPKRSPSLKDYPEADQRVQKMAAELWGNVDGEKIKSARVGKGMILSGMEMQEALDLIKVVPDCRLADEDPALFIHRNMGNSDIYYISNQSDNQITIAPEFRVSGLSPELWDPITGVIRDLPAYVQNENTTIVPLNLEASGSQFIIFRKKADKASSAEPAVNFPEEESLVELSGPWGVTFDVSGRGPLKPVVFDKLQDWTSSSNDSIKYYSGTAFYKTTFSLDKVDPESRLFVDLGTVKAMAKVKLNGEYVGGVWTAPWKADISEAVNAGENILEVEVVNTWVNRLIGDSRLPAAERKTWCSVNPFKPDSPLDPSGLMGPVRIVSVTF